MIRRAGIVILAACFGIVGWVLWQRHVTAAPQVCEGIETIDQWPRDSFALQWPVYAHPVTHHQTFGARDCCLDIAHAGGAFAGFAYSNSLEALDASYAAGRRVFELDIQPLADGSLVLAHDFDDFTAPPTSREAFLATPSPRGGVTRLDFDRLADWLVAHPEAVIVTDTNFDGGPERIAAALETRFSSEEIARRVVFQLYSTDEIAQTRLRDKGYRVLLTIYRLGDITDADLIAAVTEHKVAALTLPLKRAMTSVPVLRQALPELPLYVHGSPRRINYQRVKACMQVLGASGFYLD